MVNEAKESSENGSKTSEEIAKKYGLETLMTSKEVAEYFDVERGTVTKWVKEGYLVPFRIGDIIRFKLDEVKRFLSEGRPD